jgi:DNA-binding transcriptional MerR regulator
MNPKNIFISMGGNSVEILRDRYTITELSKSLKITDHALRYYEKEFGIKIPKDERGRRYYSTELANVMYQIKAMRDQGLEIKAIRKILETQSILNEPSPVMLDEDSKSLIKIENSSNSNDIKVFFDDFKEQLVISVAAEVSSAKEHLSKEISKSKLELGACVENSVRKLEFKMDKHFSEVDRSLGMWREKKKRGFFKNLFRKR